MIPRAIARLLACAFLILSGHGAVAAQEATLALIGVSVVPMTEERVISGQTVLIRDGRIAAIGPQESVPVPADARRIDGRGRFLIPGLADMHVHLEYYDTPAYLQAFLLHGVTTVRGMDGRPEALEWRRSAAAGALLAPRIYSAGQVLDGDPPVRDDNQIVRGPADAESIVAAQADASYDFVKVYANLSEDAFRAILAAASARGLPVAGHRPAAVPLDAFLASGITSIEHLGDFAEAIRAEDAEPLPPNHWSRRRLAFAADPERMRSLAETVARAGVWSVPTVVTSDRALARPELAEQWAADPALRTVDQGMVSGYWRGALARASGRLTEAEWSLVEQGRRTRRALVLALHRAGVPLMVGTDSPNPFVVPGAAVHEELQAFVEAGLTPFEALSAATRNPARFLGEESEWGTIEPGRRADLVLLDANPLEDIGATRRISGVVLGGRFLAAEELAAMRRSVEAVAAASN